MKKLFIISLLFSLPTIHSIDISSENNLIVTYQKNAKIWQTYSNLTPALTQLLANILYLLYSTSLLEYKAHQLIIPITRLNQEIRSNFYEYKNATENINTLRTLLERFSYLINARKIYNDTLQVCIEHIVNINDATLIASITQLQQEGVIALNAYAENKNQEIAEKLTSCSNILNSNLPNLHELANLYQKFEQGAFTDYFKNNTATENIVALASIDDLLKNNIIAIKNSENILNTIDNASDYLTTLIGHTSDIYKYYYSLAYILINQDDYEESYRLTLFGMNDTLSDELRSPLPHPDKVLEHVLTTVKEFYTHVELTR